MNIHQIISTGVLLAALGSGQAAQPAGRWSEEKANAWYQQTGWLAGCNFSPSTAINQLEMWQADSFDPATTDRELGWAQSLGFNSVRVFLHQIPWDQDRKGYLRRMEQFLSLAAKHQIGVMFVLFDSCWDPFPKAGKQRAPKPFVHNSGWVQCPGIEILKDPKRQDELKGFVQGVIGHFRNDPRIHFWDLFNEPDNNNASSYGQVELTNKADVAFVLLQKAFVWAREINPAQPLSAGVWLGDWSSPEKLSPINRFMLESSDIITFHNYADLDELRGRVTALQRYHRPVICTEYMARPVKSTFDPNLGYLKSQNVGAYNWGFVSGKTQTIFPWDSWKQAYTAEPPLWFHDIFRANGDPYLPQETEYIRKITGKK